MNPSRKLLAAALPLVGLSVGGCTSIPQDSGFADVKKLVGDRMPQTVEWKRGTADDDAADAKVDALLADELTADAAVQVALLNNRDLQATYESFAVGQADLVEAGLLLNPVFDAQIRVAEGAGGVGVDIGVIQDFLDVFQIPLRKRVAAASFEGAKGQVAGAVVDLAGVRAADPDLQQRRHRRLPRPRAGAAGEPPLPAGGGEPARRGGRGHDRRGRGRPLTPSQSRVSKEVP